MYRRRQSGPLYTCLLWVGVSAYLSAYPSQAQEAPRFDFATAEAFKIPGLEIDAEQGWGFSFADYNNDGYPDLFISETAGRLNLFENEGGKRFTSRGFNLQVQRQRHEKGKGAVWGDMDNDGDLDLHVPVGTVNDDLNTKHAMMVQRNDKGVFRVVTESAGLSNNQSLEQSIWLDYDRDGYLDLYVSPSGASRSGILDRLEEPTPERRNRLYRNNGDATFADVTQAAGLNVELSPFSGGSANSGLVATDLNGDGWIDLFVPSEEGPSRIFFNNGEGGFEQSPITDDLINIDRPTGVACGDIDNDGDIDLLLASGGSSAIEVLKFRAQLLLNLGDGQLVDITEGAGLGVLTQVASHVPTMGDFDNDGDLDISVSALSPETPHLLFLNNGDGTFVDANREAGIGGVFLGRAVGDYNLDGALDLVFSTFDRPSLAAFFPAGEYPGFYPPAPPPVGGVGRCLGCERTRIIYPFYRNQGNGNHWLRVELVGTESNRSAIGARLVAVAGDARQTREIRGGDGFGQNEMVAHFGLGMRQKVDALEVHWPSGRVETLTDIAADQRIRVIEGSGAFHAVRPTTWDHALPDEATLGTDLTVNAIVSPALFDPQARIKAVTADLSAFGGGEDVPLVDQDDGSWLLEASLPVEGLPGIRELSVLIDQETAAGAYWTRLSKTLLIQSEVGYMLFGDGPAPGWGLESVGEARVESESTVRVKQGSSAQALNIGDDEAVYRLEASDTGDGPWIYPAQRSGIDLLPFTHLSFWLHTAEARIESLYVDIAHGSVVIPTWGPSQVRARVSLIGTQKTLLPEVHALLYEIEDPSERLELLKARDADRGMWDLGNRYLDLDLPSDDWVEVHVPIDSLIGFEADLPLSEVRFSGKVDGTIYVDELRLTRNPPGATMTAVLESHDATTPEAFALAQNYPNPFNSGTVIRFALPQQEAVELTVFNMAGQKVATLVDGQRPGGAYTVHWDGADDKGQALATGLYLYRLEAGERSETKKLLLLR